jgi:DNA-directed RNA polymerase sigma subunit (sigma70/sigma32)
MADIGKSMGLSRERVRQIEVGALQRIRAAM